MHRKPNYKTRISDLKCPFNALRDTTNKYRCSHSVEFHDEVDQMTHFEITSRLKFNDFALKKGIRNFNIDLMYKIS